MTSWQDIRQEISRCQRNLSKEDLAKGVNGLDVVRRRKYQLVKKITKRPLLVYATCFHKRSAPDISIEIADKDGFYEVIRNIKSNEIDIFIHSPGGSIEATESIVKVLRSKFSKIRFIVTGTAKSAATMLALSGDSILMDEAGELGPIDPQVLVRGGYFPAGSILEQFDKAAEDIQKDPSRLVVWNPILRELAPSLLISCKNFINLARNLSKDWLTQFMFRGDPDASTKAHKISQNLADEKNSLSHGRRIDAEHLLKLGVKIEMLKDANPRLRDAIRELHLAIMTTFDETVAVKIFENSEGAALIRMQPLPPSLPPLIPM